MNVVIKEKYPGGWDQCLRDHADLIGGRVWYDEYLLRDGAMGPSGIESLIEEWMELGFEPIISHNGKDAWKDVCVVESFFGRTTLPCDWIVVDTEARIAYLKGTPPGDTVGRGNVVLVEKDQ